jgi:hypothetical protein
LSVDERETTAAEDRARTMQVRALRRLSTCEVAGLGIALEQLEVVEAELVEALPKLRDAATKEANVRHARGLPPAGPYVRAWSGIRSLLSAVSAAREETSTVTEVGRVAKR